VHDVTGAAQCCHYAAGVFAVAGGHVELQLGAMSGF
jgi:hypothetical protein